MNRNRAEKYGDGLFETIRVCNGKAMFLERHYQRLSKGLQQLRLDGNQSFTFEQFQTHILKEIEKQGRANLRIRMTFFRLGGGKYSPQSQSFGTFIESSSLDTATYTLNNKGLHIGIAQSVRLSMDQLAPLKTISALPYVMAAIEKQEQGWDDALLLNHKEAIAEAVAANVFVLKEQTLYTPAPTEGAVAGTMQAQVLAMAADFQLDVQPTRLSLQALKTADELWLTNAIQGIQWVQKVIGEATYQPPKVALQLVQALNDRHALK